MLDANNRHIGLGANVLTGEMPGVVVCSIDTDEYAVAYPKEQWGYLESGVLVETEGPWLVWVHNPSQIELKKYNSAVSWIAPAFMALIGRAFKASPT
jgi:hypothetical protein